MQQNRWIRARHAAVALGLGLAALPVLAGAALPAVSFTPAAPASSNVITADLPFMICAWTIVATPAHIDINYVLAPCSQQAFTDKIPLGQLAAGTYTVTVNVLQQGIPIPQAIGILGVTAAVTPTPAVGSLGLLLCSLGLIALAAGTLRGHGARAAAPSARS